MISEIAQRDKNIAEGNMNAHKIKKTQARYDQMVYWYVHTFLAVNV